MRRVKTRIFAGDVCEQIVFFLPDSTKDIRRQDPKPRFQNEQERAEHKLGISRRNHARIFNANFGPQSLYSTLTMDDENEVHTFLEAKKIRDNFVRRLKYHFPNVQLMIYMGRGKHTHRIHLHMVSNGVSEQDILRLWGMGEIRRVEHLKEHNFYNGVDHGRDYTGLANYLFNHWTEEQGGHRWKQTSNLDKPEREKNTEVKRNYSEKKPPVPPKGFIFVEARATKYGFLYFKYVREPEPVKRTRKRKSG